ncbi:MAG: leucine-rich repeat protein [Bacillota bacterium]|nr:leucine-rich repeat protein [Bacillota bacterium]
MQTKKIMAVFLAVALMIGLLPMTSFAASTDIVITNHTAGNLYTELNTATSFKLDQITGISVSGGKINAADWMGIYSAMVASNKVTTVDLSGTSASASVPDNLFSGIPSLETFILPSGIDSIGTAFSSCTGLRSITIPEGVTSIGDYAFSGDTSLTSITIPTSVTSVGNEAFNGCTNLSSVVILGSVASIGQAAFYRCTSLSSVTIPEGPTSIGDYAFYSDTSLTAIVIPASVTSIGNEAFNGCTNLSAVTFSGTPKIAQIGNDAFYGDTSLTSVTIPASVTSIGSNAFHSCTGLSTVTIMGSITPINVGSSAFGNTSYNNAVLYVPAGSENAWDNYYDGAPNHIVSMGGGLFRIENLPPLLHYRASRISDTEAKIDIGSDEAGAYYYAIAKASDPAPTVDTAGNGISFAANNGRFGATIDVTDLSAGAYALYVMAKDSLGNMTESPYVINIEDYIPFRDVEINNHEEGKFSDELASAMSNAGIPITPYIHYDKIASLTVSGGIFNDDDWQALNDQAQDVNDNPIWMYDAQTIDLSGTSASSVPDYTFDEFYSLESVSLPSGVTGLGEDAFEDCLSLTSVTIPDSVTSIGDYAFAGCSSLASITSLAAIPPELENGCSDFFDGLPSTGKLHVPNGSVDAYTSAWSSYLPGGWTIVDATSSNGGGSFVSSNPNPTYNADVGGSDSQTTLPVTFDTGSRTASVDLGSQSFSPAGTVITVPSIPDADTYSAGISVSDLSTSAAQGTLTINTEDGSITVPSDMLTGTSDISKSKAVISIGQGDKTALPAEVQATIGNHPLIQLGITIDGKQTEWNNPKAPVTVSIPYKPTAAELQNPDSIVIWYIDGSGKAISVPNGHYDPITGTVTFQTTHFSNYAVAYNPESFNDVAAGAWYYKAVSFIAARNITGGTGNGNYSPDAKLTRGDFLVMLMKSYNIAADTNPADNFSDAGNTYFTGYLAAAKRLGISSGVGNNMYAPEKEITRQEMFTLLYNVLKVTGKIPQGNSGKTLSYFTDARQVSSWAEEAIAVLVKTGVIGGNNGMLTPTSTTTRAEMAQVLYNLLLK